MNPYLTRKIKVLSFWAMVAVVVIHGFNSQPRYLLPWSTMEEGWNLSSFLQFFLSNGAARFAVPLFFMISGYLFFRTYDGSAAAWRKKVGARVRSLVLPFWIWNVVAIGVIFVFMALPWTEAWVPGWMKERTWDQYLLSFILGPVGYQLWYLRDLFLYILLAPLWNLLLSRKVPGRILLAAAALVALPHVPLPVFDLTGLFFFLWGGRFGTGFQKVEKSISRRNWEILLGVWVFLLVVRTALSAYEPLGAAALYFPVEILGVGVFWYGYDHLVRKERALGDFKPGDSTLMIYFGHVPLLPLLTEIALGLTGNTLTTQMIFYFLLPAVVIFILMGLDGLLKKVAPLRSFLLGGRS